MIAVGENTSIRPVARVMAAVQTSDGDGVELRRAFPNQGLMQIDPFLILDHLGPKDYGPGEIRGFPPHPHRGFETVTYVLDGRMEHRDSFGHRGQIGPGDVQWMTAGSGLVHSETPEREFARKGGRFHGFQLWVNLPRQEKMTAPHYQEVPAASFPLVPTPDGRGEVKVIAGEALGVQAPITTRTPILYLHVTLQPGGRFETPLPERSNAFAYIISGAGQFGAEERPASEGHLVLFGQAGDQVAVAAKADAPLEILLLAGVPLNEPVVQYGPFVMNTKAEIYQAFEDYQNGRMGVLAEED